MKISIITIHNIVNFGSVFQARALYKYIKDTGNECQILNYCPRYLYHTSIKSELGKLLNLKHFISRKRKFDRFVNNEMLLSNRKYKNWKDLKHNCPDSDLFVSGGDQLWNEFYRCGKDDSYKLTFTNKPKIAFGTSLGKSTFSDNGIKYLSEAVSGYRALGIREKSGVRLLSDSGLKNVKHVCDPIFLLDREDYQQYYKKPIMEEPYLFVYLVPASPLLDRALEMISKKTKLKVVMNTGFIAKGNYDYHIKDMGPEECINYLANANFVLSGSFHATAFSLLFHKPFVTLLPGVDTNARIEDILELVGLPDRMASKESDLSESMFNGINWEIVDKRLEEHIKKSKEFLNESIDNIIKQILSSTGAINENSTC